MRGYSFAGRDALQEDGGNLSAVIYRICQSDQDKEVLLDFVRSLPEQQITEIDFIETDRRDVMVRLKETFGDSERLVDAPLLSDGTLRVLAVGSSSPKCGEGHFGHPRRDRQRRASKPSRCARSIDPLDRRTARFESGSHIAQSRTSRRAG